MVKTALACSLVFNLLEPSISSVSKPLAFKQVEQSKNVSQLLRSNADHYWSTVRDPKNLKDLANYVQEQGIINGDPHLGNFSVVPVKSKKGKPELKFLNIDFDDGGRGPFALEFARYVAVAKASSGAIKVKDMLNAYVEGLRGKKMTEPDSINAAENMKIADYEKARAKYVSKRMLDSRFKYKEGEIEAWQGRPNIDDVAAVFKDMKVLDVAKRPMERGGSMDSVRLWVLVQDKSGSHRIFELKEYLDTALTQYSRQPEMQERLDGLFDTFWKKTDPSSYTVSKVLDKTYWVREKKVEILEYADKAAEDEGRIYIANLIGRFQGRQAEGAAYLAKIEKDPELFKETVKNFVRDYLAGAEALLIK